MASSVRIQIEHCARQGQVLQKAAGIDPGTIATLRHQLLALPTPVTNAEAALLLQRLGTVADDGMIDALMQVIATAPGPLVTTHDDGSVAISAEMKRPHAGSE